METKIYFLIIICFIVYASRYRIIMGGVLGVFLTELILMIWLILDLNTRSSVLNIFKLNIFILMGGSL